MLVLMRHLNMKYGTAFKSNSHIHKPPSVNDVRVYFKATHSKPVLYRASLPIVGVFALFRHYILEVTCFLIWSKNTRMKYSLNVSPGCV